MKETPARSKKLSQIADLLLKTPATLSGGKREKWIEIFRH